jgi:peptide/nickel transport system substrate-binding protein
LRSDRTQRRRAFIRDGGAGLITLAGLRGALAQPSRGGTLVIGSPYASRGLNPAVATGIPTMLPGVQLFASPLTVGSDWKPRPYLAERFELSADNRSVTLNLRRDATFHDGRPLTSEDVQFSIEALRDHHPFRTMFGPVNAVTLTDRHTAVVRLSEPHPALLLAMTTSLCPILPKHVYGDGAPLPTHPRNATNVVGSGPFRVAEFRLGEALALERFDRFFAKEQVRLDRLLTRFYKDSATLPLALERGEIDYAIALDTRDIERLRKNPSLRIDGNVGPAVGPLCWISFNCQHPVLQDRRVRQAINFAIDKEFIVGSLFGGAHFRATGPIARNSPLHDPHVERYPLNLARAAALLDEAGLRPGPGGVRLTLNVDATPGTGEHRTIQEYLRPALSKVGITATPRVSPDGATWVRRISSHQFDLNVEGVFNWGDPVIGVHRSWISSNIREGVIYSNTHRYSNPEVDRLCAQAGREMDAARRKSLYSRMQKLVVDDCPAAFVYETNSHVAMSRRVIDPPAGIWGPLGAWDATGLRAA